MRSRWKLCFNILFNKYKKNRFFGGIMPMKEGAKLVGKNDEKLRTRLTLNERGLVFFNYPRKAIVGKRHEKFFFTIHSGRKFFFFRLSNSQYANKFGEFCFTRLMGKDIHYRNEADSSKKIQKKK